jgi:hypothetical protein
MSWQGFVYLAPAEFAFPPAFANDSYSEAREKLPEYAAVEHFYPQSIPDLRDLHLAFDLPIAFREVKLFEASNTSG